MPICGCSHEQELHDQTKYECKVKDCGCEEFITDVEKWKKCKKHWDYLDAEDARVLSEAFHEDQFEREEREREWQDEQEHNLAYCPLCGSRRVHGRCPACERAFGRD